MVKTAIFIRKICLWSDGLLISLMHLRLRLFKKTLSLWTYRLLNDYLQNWYA